METRLEPNHTFKKEKFWDGHKIVANVVKTFTEAKFFTTAFWQRDLKELKGVGTSLRRKGIYYPQTLESTHFSVSVGIVQWIMALMQFMRALLFVIWTQLNILRYAHVPPQSSISLGELSSSSIVPLCSFGLLMH